MAERRKCENDPEEVIILDNYIKEDKEKLAKWEKDLKVVETRLTFEEM